MAHQQAQPQAKTDQIRFEEREVVGARLDTVEMLLFEGEG